MLKWRRISGSSNRLNILTQIKLLFFRKEFNISMHLQKIKSRMNRKTMIFTKNCKRLLKINSRAALNKKKVKMKVKKNKK